MFSKLLPGSFFDGGFQVVFFRFVSAWKTCIFLKNLHRKHTAFIYFGQDVSPIFGIDFFALKLYTKHNN